MREGINHAACYVRDHVHTKELENSRSLLRQMLDGPYATVEPVHIFPCLHEQMFRFNNRKTADGFQFVRVLESITGKRLTYPELIGQTMDVSSSTADGDAENVVL